MELDFIPIDYSNFDFNENNYVRLIGRTREGKRICVIDNYDANFWVILKENVNEKRIDSIKKEIEKIEIKSASRTTKVLKTEIFNKKFLGKEVKAIKVFITNYKDAHAVADRIDFDEVDKRREFDISLISKYIMEKNINPLTWHSVSGELLKPRDFEGINFNLNIDLCIKAEKIWLSENQEVFEPKILAFDIEADEFEIGKGDVLMISLYGKNFKKVLTWKKCSIRQDFVECSKNEKDMLERFVHYVREYDADILTGYFSDGFDLPYLRANAIKNKIRLSLGVDKSQPIFARGRIPSGKLSGIVHVDLFRFIEAVYSQYLQSETLSLDEVASELLGERKCEFDFAKLMKMKEDDWRQFFEYNLNDSCLTYKLAEKLWPDLFEFTKIMKEPLFDVSRDSMSSHVENYILHNLSRFNEIAEKRPLHDEIILRRGREKYEGAFVFQPKPGLYENIVIFDFTSMHASIIVSFNISKSTFLEKKQKDSYESPELDFNGKKIKFYFSKKSGFFPELLSEIVDKRKQFKKELKKNPNPILKARSNAYKLLANASYGYLGFFGARYYCVEAAATTLALVRKFTNETIKKIESNGYEVIYSDTDSVAFLAGNKSQNNVLDLLGVINSELPGIMELELEDFYKRGLFVSKRTVKLGAKKKYALIDFKNKLKIRGFETVRRDWCELTRDLQNKVLEKVLTNGDEKEALKLIKEVVSKVKRREIDKKLLIIKSQLRKDIMDYKAISPHVIAARKMIEQDIPISQGSLIEFYIAENNQKKSLVREKVKLPNEEGNYDINYYLERQVLPAVENILEVFGVDIKNIINGKKQMKLGEF
ncbi:MAG: DNA polymerase domain-containing protein [Nanoarchaeota archaeon]